jgi:hypothetical protein
VSVEEGAAPPPEAPAGEPIALSKTPSRGGLLAWNGTETVELKFYPADARWIAFPNRQSPGGWWVAYHELRMGERFFCGNQGPWPRVMVEEFFSTHGNRPPTPGAVEVEGKPAPAGELGGEN